MRSLIAIFLLTTVQFGCAANRLEALMGHDLNDAIAQFGPPTHVLPDGHGGTAVTWQTARTTYNPGYLANAPMPAAETNSQALFGGMANGLAQGMNPPRMETSVSNKIIWFNSAGIAYRHADN